MAADTKALEAVADRLLAAKYPVLMAEYVARSEGGFDNLVALAETVGAAVFDVHARLNFPNRHPLNLSCEKEIFRDADLILSLDTRDWEKSTHFNDRTKRQVVPHYPPHCEMIEIGFGEINLSKWSMDYGRMPACSLRVLGDTLTAIPELTRICRERIAKNPALAKTIAERTKLVAQKHDAMFKKWAEEAKKDWDGLPITLPRLASEIWDAIKAEDWVLTGANLQDWCYKLWDLDKAYRHCGQALGTGTQIGTSLGVALAHRDKGRLVVDIQPDGDLMFDAGALWSAAKNNIPMLIVMYNNRAYYNDWEHQIRVAQFSRHAGRARLYRARHQRPGARLRHHGEEHGLVRRRPDRKARRHRAGAAPRHRAGEGRQAGAGRYGGAAAVINPFPRRVRRRPVVLELHRLHDFFHHAAERHAMRKQVGFLEHDGHVLLGPWHRLLLDARGERPVAGARSDQRLAQGVAVDAELIAELEALVVGRDAGPENQIVDHLADLAGAERAEVKNGIGEGGEGRPAGVERLPCRRRP